MLLSVVSTSSLFYVQGQFLQCRSFLQEMATSDCVLPCFFLRTVKARRDTATASACAHHYCVIFVSLHNAIISAYIIVRSRFMVRWV